jgi:hypothetical protein
VWVKLTGKVVNLVAQAMHNPGPFACFQRDAVGSRQAKRDKANVHKGSSNVGLLTVEQLSFRPEFSRVRFIE